MSTRSFSLVDATSYDGDVYEVANKVIAQAAALGELLAECIDDCDRAARNAQMSRNLLEDPSDAGGDRWTEHVQHVKLSAAKANVENVVNTLKHVRQAATYDPKHPPKIS